MPAGDLVRPETVGAHAVEICRISGMRAGATCPHITEWFAPGTEPVAECNWHRDGRVALPAEYAEWAAQQTSSLVASDTLASAEAHGANDSDVAIPLFRIVSPRNGDRYAVPPGVPSRFATIPLLAAGAASGRTVMWYIDGRRTLESRLTLSPGAHTIRAVSAGAQHEVRVTVE